MNTRTNWLLAGLAGAMLFASCQKDQLMNPSNTATGGIQVKEGILVFQDRETYEKTIAELQNKSTDEISSWEKRHNGFVSMHTAFNEIVKAENTYAAQFENLNEAQAKAAGFDVNGHSALAWSKPYLAIEKTFDDGAKYLTMNIWSGIMSDFTDEHGLIAIGDSIYRCTENKIFALRGGVERKQELISESAADMVQYEPSSPVSLLRTAPTTQISGAFTISNTGDAGRYRMITTVQQWNSGSNIYKVSERGQTYRKRLLSSVYDPFTVSQMVSTGAFSGPYSPSFYYLPNPYTSISGFNVQDVTVIHCANDGPLEMTHATYQVNAYDNGGGFYCQATVQW